MLQGRHFTDLLGRGDQMCGASRSTFYPHDGLAAGYKEGRRVRVLAHVGAAGIGLFWTLYQMDFDLSTEGLGQRFMTLAEALCDVFCEGSYDDGKSVLEGLPDNLRDRDARIHGLLGPSFNW